MTDYKNEQIWRDMQTHLPPKNRLSDVNVPDEYFIPINGMDIHIDHYQNDNAKARVILFHGVGGNGRVLSLIALPLFQSGYDIVCPDLPLYGCTQTNNIAITYDTWVACGKSIVQHYQSKDNLSTFVFGLSAGGMLAYQVACECEDISGILATCILDQRDINVTKATASSPLIATLGKPLMRITYKLFGRIRIPMRFIGNMKAITNDADLAELLMGDKKSAGVSVPLSFVYTMLEPEISVEPENFDKCPFILVHPEDDRWTDISVSRIFYDRLSCKKELHMLKGAGHVPVEEYGLRQMEECCIDFLENTLDKVDDV